MYTRPGVTVLTVFQWYVVPLQVMSGTLSLLAVTLISRIIPSRWHGDSGEVNLPKR